MKDKYKLDTYNYFLPEELIAQEPVKPRDSSRLLILKKDTGEIEHRKFSDIIDFLRAGDLLILNNTKVIPARLFGTKIGGNSDAELLLLSPLPGKSNSWEALVRPGRRLKPGNSVLLPNGIEVRIEEYMEDGTRKISFPENIDVIPMLHKIGEVPLPPYIHNRDVPASSYQTVFAEKDGSSAAPTASLHFTKELLERIRSMGVETAWVTLHVGLGTFRPVKEDDIRDHNIHREICEVPTETRNVVNAVKNSGGRIIAIGTTVVRTLESFSDEKNILQPGKKHTELFVYPGYSFRIVDSMVTNFHLPKSTLLMLVAAFAGYDNTINAYKEAVHEKYRFFSFGDAMIVI